MKATNLEELWRYCDPYKELPFSGRGAEWFVDCSSVRKSFILESIQKELGFATADNFIRFGIVGHPGSGKSTELNKVYHHLSDENIIVKIAADYFFDLDSDTGVHPIVQLTRGFKELSQQG